MLVEIAGIDGSGKTTLINRLRKVLNDKTNVWAYERNFKNRGKRFLEEIALGKGYSRCEELFDPHLVEFANAIEMVEEAHRNFYFLNDHSRQIYLVDQYGMSWLATAKRHHLGITKELEWIYAYLPKPDLSIYLDVQPETALERLHHRTKGDQILALDDPLGHLQELKDAFDQVFASMPYLQVKVDASQDEETVFSTVFQTIEQSRKW